MKNLGKSDFKLGDQPFNKTYLMKLKNERANKK